MVKEMVIESIQVGNGGVIADMKLKTESGIVGMRAVLELRKHPEVVAAVNMLEEAIEKTLVSTVIQSEIVEEAGVKQ